MDGAAPGSVRLRLDVSYDGSGFHGFAENRGVSTVGATLRSAIERVLRVPVELTCAGRTDTGVHARGQVVTLDVPVAALDALGARDRRGRGGAVRLRDSLNGLVGPAVVVRSVTEVPGDFDARFSAAGRTYRYTVLNSDVPDPFLADRSWLVDVPLDLDAMQAAAGHVVGEHDFSSFCRRPRPSDGDAAAVSLVRQVTAAEWSVVEDGNDAGTPPGDDRRLLRFTISATAFCHQMVRSITGLLVDVGRGRRRPDEVVEVLAARDRSRAGRLAPPHGLILWSVEY